MQAIFFVTEQEYPKLQAACPADFPFAYGEFITRVEQTIDFAPAIVTKVNVNVDEFLAWCAKSGFKPTNIARAQYATLMLNTPLRD